MSLPSAQQLRRGPARLRPFAPVLHLHRANQAVAHACTTQPRVSPHNVVNHSSLRSDHSGPRTLLVLNLPLDECIDNTHSHHMKKKEKINNETKQAPQVIKSPDTRQKQDHLRAKLVPTPHRGGKKGSTPSVHKEQNHQSNDPKELPLNTCKLPLNICKLPKTGCTQQRASLLTPVRPVSTPVRPVTILCTLHTGQTGVHTGWTGDKRKIPTSQIASQTV